MYREAIVELEAALAIRRKAGDEAAVAQTLNNLANANRGMGDLVRAEQLLLDSLALREKLHGRDDIRVAQVLTSLGSLYDARGDFSRGESTYDRALKILRARDLREDDSLLVIVVNNFGLLLQNRGDLNGARPLLEQALQLREKLLAKQPDHPQIATALMNLASNYQESGQLGDAERLYTRALGIFTRRTELDTLPVATLSVNLAMIHLLRGEFDRADRSTSRASASGKKSLEPIILTPAARWSGSRSFTRSPAGRPTHLQRCAAPWKSPKRILRWSSRQDPSSRRSVTWIRCRRTPTSCCP